jgi:SPP1 gp7 family putative phage head morphogenesis protein
MPRNLRNPLDWMDWEDELWDELAPDLLGIIGAGAVVGEAALPPAYRLLINWDLVNDNAIDYLRRYRLSTIHGIMESTRERSMNIVEQWIQSGERLDVLTAQLEHLFDARRAETIAVTEVTRIYSEGNQAAWKSTDGLVAGNRWSTAMDEKVCPVCAPLDGVVANLGDGFGIDENGEGVADTEGILGPPAHVNCRCWLTPVLGDAKSFGDLMDRKLNEVQEE